MDKIRNNDGTLTYIHQGKVIIRNSKRDYKYVVLRNGEYINGGYTIFSNSFSTASRFADQWNREFSRHPKDYDEPQKCEVVIINEK